VSDELNPCRLCGSECSVQKIDGESVKGTLWVCSNDTLFGGNCADGRAYMSATAWNDGAPEEDFAAQMHKTLMAIDEFLVSFNDPLATTIKGIVSHTLAKEPRTRQGIQP